MIKVTIYFGYLEWDEGIGDTVLRNITLTVPMCESAAKAIRGKSIYSFSAHSEQRNNIVPKILQAALYTQLGIEAEEIGYWEAAA